MMNMVIIAHWKMPNQRVIQIASAGEFTTNGAMIETSLYVPMGLMLILPLLPAVTLNPVMSFLLY